MSKIFVFNHRWSRWRNYGIDLGTLTSRICKAVTLREAWPVVFGSSVAVTASEPEILDPFTVGHTWLIHGKFTVRNHKRPCDLGIYEKIWLFPYGSEWGSLHECFQVCLVTCSENPSTMEAVRRILNWDQPGLHSRPYLRKEKEQNMFLPYNEVCIAGFWLSLLP